MSISNSLPPPSDDVKKIVEQASKMKPVERGWWKSFTCWVKVQWLQRGDQVPQKILTALANRKIDFQDLRRVNDTNKGDVLRLFSELRRGKIDKKLSQQLQNRMQEGGLQDVLSTIQKTSDVGTQFLVAVYKQVATFNQNEQKKAWIGEQSAYQGAYNNPHLQSYTDPDLSDVQAKLVREQIFQVWASKGTALQDLRSEAMQGLKKLAHDEKRFQLLPEVRGRILKLEGDYAAFIQEHAKESGFDEKVNMLRFLKDQKMDDASIKELIELDLKKYEEKNGTLIPIRTQFSKSKDTANQDVLKLAGSIQKEREQEYAQFQEQFQGDTIEKQHLRSFLDPGLDPKLIKQDLEKIIRFLKTNDRNIGIKELLTPAIKEFAESHIQVKVRIDRLQDAYDAELDKAAKYPAKEKVNSKFKEAYKARIAPIKTLAGSAQAQPPPKPSQKDIESLRAMQAKKPSQPQVSGKPQEVVQNLQLSASSVVQEKQAVAITAPTIFGMNEPMPLYENPKKLEDYVKELNTAIRAKDKKTLNLYEKDLYKKFLKKEVINIEKLASDRRELEQQRKRLLQVGYWNYKFRCHNRWPSGQQALKSLQYVFHTTDNEKIEAGMKELQRRGLVDEATSMSHLYDPSKQEELANLGVPIKTELDAAPTWAKVVLTGLWAIPNKYVRPKINTLFDQKVLTRLHEIAAGKYKKALQQAEETAEPPVEKTAPQVVSTKLQQPTMNREEQLVQQQTSQNVEQHEKEAVQAFSEGVAQQRAPLSPQPEAPAVQQESKPIQPSVKKEPLQTVAEQVKPSKSQEPAERPKEAQNVAKGPKDASRKASETVKEQIVTPPGIKLYSNADPMDQRKWRLIQVSYTQYRASENPTPELARHYLAYIFNTNDPEQIALGAQALSGLTLEEIGFNGGELDRKDQEDKRKAAGLDFNRVKRKVMGALLKMYQATQKELIDNMLLTFQGQAGIDRVTSLSEKNAQWLKENNIGSSLRFASELRSQLPSELQDILVRKFEQLPEEEVVQLMQNGQFPAQLGSEVLKKFSMFKDPLYVLKWLEDKSVPIPDDMVAKFSPAINKMKEEEINKLIEERRLPGVFLPIIKEKFIGLQNKAPALLWLSQHDENFPEGILKVTDEKIELNLAPNDLVNLIETLRLPKEFLNKNVMGHIISVLDQSKIRISDNVKQFLDVYRASKGTKASKRL